MELRSFRRRAGARAPHPGSSTDDGGGPRRQRSAPLSGPPEGALASRLSAGGIMLGGIETGTWILEEAPARPAAPERLRPPPDCLLVGQRNCLQRGAAAGALCWKLVRGAPLGCPWQLPVSSNRCSLSPSTKRRFCAMRGAQLSRAETSTLISTAVGCKRSARVGSLPAMPAGSSVAPHTPAHMRAVLC